MDSFEKEAFSGGYDLLCGVDEAGRGPLAGPVVAAAVVFSNPLPPIELGIRDSKTLTPARRRTLVFEIMKRAVSVGVGVVWNEEVDRINIHRATLWAMEKAVRSLSLTPDLLLIDGPHRIDSPVPQRPIVGGDALSMTIAAASIMAKTARDNIMVAYHRIFPEYNFLKNKGYPTKEHLQALAASGPSPVHRRTFRGVISEGWPRRQS